MFALPSVQPDGTLDQPVHLSLRVPSGQLLPSGGQCRLVARQGPAGRSPARATLEKKDGRLLRYAAGHEVGH